MSSLDVPSSDITLFHFIGDNCQVSINHELIKKYSKYIDAIIWSPEEVMSVPIPKVDGYTSLQIRDHLAYILDQLYKLRPTLLNFQDPLIPEVKRVGGSLANLKIYLILCLHCDIDIFVNIILISP
jgi:hypothetical protein